MLVDLLARRYAAALFAAMSCLPLGASAENHALIMWIGEYADPRANLPGIELDAKNARKIAVAMGVPEKNIVEASNAQLTLKGIADAIGGLAARIRQGDKVLIYYSGHGSQRPNTGGGRKCSEGLVAQDVQMYFDQELESDLSRLAGKASQVVMMNDSCFSGGASVKSMPERSMVTPKAWNGAVGSKADASERACGDAVNKAFLTKNLEVVRRQGANLLYIAAAADNEIAFASAQGSVATQAWAACTAAAAGADKDRSGTVSGEELRACAQARINARPQAERQTLTLTGTGSLPVSFAGDDDKPAAPVDAARALEDIRAGSDASYRIKLTPAKSTMHIGRDHLDFSVETNQEGYLYLLQVGSDGKTFNLLFPNKVDADNRITAGTHRFPRDTWAVRSAGPAGTNYLMALVSSAPKDFSRQMKQTGTFASAPATRGTTKNLVVVATGGASGGNGRYGTSAVVSLKEAP